MREQEKFKTTVVIPVYNAERFLVEAVESIVHHPEVDTLFLIEDKSPDNALHVALDLAQRYDKIQVLQHPSQANKGAGASRNLGIEAARTKWITFLDADDVAANNRFVQTKAIIAANADCEAVYEAVGTLNSRGAIGGDYETGASGMVTMVNQAVQPADLFDFMEPIKRNGGISTIGVTATREALMAVGNFDTTLRVSQDTLMWLRLAARGRFYGGAQNVIVAYRRIHSGNRGRISSNHQMFRSLLFGNLALNETGYTLARRRQAFVLVLSLIHAAKTIRLRRGHGQTQVWRVMPRGQAVKSLLLIANHSPRILLELFKRIRSKNGLGDA